MVVGVARVIVSACIFLIAEKVTRSDRAAGVASLVYAANPMFLFWSSAFSYEDLGLPLVFFAVWWLGRTRTAARYPAQLITVVVIFAVTVTHHYPLSRSAPCFASGTSRPSWPAGRVRNGAMSARSP